MNYGYDGGPKLLAHLEEYFDTPEHAAFAIQLVTNPQWQRETGRFESADDFRAYGRIKDLLAKHVSLLRSTDGASTLALLAMRTALRMGDPSAARQIADTVPADAAIRATPDFNWMSASARFLSHDYASAEQPLLALFRSSSASAGQRAAAAYGLCGVYWKSRNVTERLRFALWLHAQDRRDESMAMPAGLADLSVYWASSGWDLGMLLDTEAPVDALQSFVDQNPGLARYPAREVLVGCPADAGEPVRRGRGNLSLDSGAPPGSSPPPSGCALSRGKSCGSDRRAGKRSEIQSSGVPKR
jgi:hypothetical protein